MLFFCFFSSHGLKALSACLHKRLLSRLPRLTGRLALRRTRQRSGVAWITQDRGEKIRHKKSRSRPLNPALVGKKHHSSAQWERNQLTVKNDLFFFYLSFFLWQASPPLPPVNLIVIHPFHNFSPFLYSLFFFPRLTCATGQNLSVTSPFPALLILCLSSAALSLLFHTLSIFFPSGTPACSAPPFLLLLLVGRRLPAITFSCRSC